MSVYMYREDLGSSASLSGLDNLLFAPVTIYTRAVERDVLADERKACPTVLLQIVYYQWNRSITQASCHALHCSFSSHLCIISEMEKVWFSIAEPLHSL